MPRVSPSPAVRPVARFLRLVVLCCLAGILLPGSPAIGVEGWALLKQPGIVALLRHAEAPGGGNVPFFGDPKEFRIEDCATQRNLSEAGRAHARRIGEALRKEQIAFTQVLSSQWCRCMETARLALGREAEPLPALNNFFDDRSRAPAQIAELKAYIASLAPDRRALMVSHGVVISALTGIAPREGEFVVLRLDGKGGFSVAGRLWAE